MNRICLFVSLLCALARGQGFLPPFEAAAVVADDQARFEGVLDYDGDGRKDAVSVWLPTLTSVTVRGYLNDGAGKLQPDWSITVAGIVNPPGFNPVTLVGTGDFDADGRDDFVLVFNDVIGWWLSNGAGVVPTIAWVLAPIPTYYDEIVTGDVSGDGRADLVLRKANAISIFTSQPLAPPTITSFSLGQSSDSTHVFLTEGNGDGVADVGVRRDQSSSGTLPSGIWIFAGSGSLISSMPCLAGGRLGTSGDVDGDGDLDIVLSASFLAWPNSTLILRRTSPSTFVPEDPSPGGALRKLVDWDGDGDVDGVGALGWNGAVSGANSFGTSVFFISLNDGTGVFGAPTSIEGLGGGTLGGGTHLAGAEDLNGDGQVDLVAGRCVYYGRGPGGLAPRPTPLTVLGQREVADFDSDGDPDLKLSLGSVRLNSGDGNFSTTSVIAPPPPPGLTWAPTGFPGDFDGDGDLDLLLDAAATTRILRNASGGSFVDDGPAVAMGVSMRTLFGTAAGGIPATPENSLPADLDGDGDLDLVVTSTGNPATPGSGNSRTWWNQGAGTFQFGQSLTGYVVASACDVNQDGIKDLVAQEYVGFFGVSRLVVLQGLGSTFQTPGVVLDDPTRMEDRPAVADFDGDGDLDVFSVGAGAKLILNLGNLQFSETPIPGVVWSTNTKALAFAVDVDADGLIDVVATPAFNLTPASGVSILLHGELNSAGVPQPIHQLFPAVAFADLDGDGDHDAIGPNLIARNGRFGPLGAGYRLQYGAGIPGTGGVIPVAGKTGPLRVGSPVELRIRGGLGGASGYLVVGSAAANVPLFGGTLLAEPAFLLPIQLDGIPGGAGAGSLTIPYVVPASLAGVTFYEQAGLLDPNTPAGLSATNGLRVDVGL